ncbi:MAG: DNA methyltransferase [Sporomusaceae bacterium]|nr:DNA methyltransferase [Sporomusaceae bacterium]
MIKYRQPELAKTRAGRNRTLTVTPAEAAVLRRQLLPQPAWGQQPEGIIWGDFLAVAPDLPERFVDLLFLDPPYNLDKQFHGSGFKKLTVDEYSGWLDGVIQATLRLLKPQASVYICGDWLTSASIFQVASAYFTVRNRITWEREKGRGAKANWKNCSEDLWFCTVDKKHYTFNADAVRLRRRVIAPYRDNRGRPKDWSETAAGNFRDTAASNLWTDITIPFWSMPENTDHPTQKSEKLLAKIILASSNAGDMVFDPFCGSGTTAAVAAKLGRRTLGIDLNEQYCLWAQKRLVQSAADSVVQGFCDGVFWERNTLPLQRAEQSKPDRQGPDADK